MGEQISKASLVRPELRGLWLAAQGGGTAPRSLSCAEFGAFLVLLTARCGVSRDAGPDITQLSVRAFRDVLGLDASAGALEWDAFLAAFDAYQAQLARRA
mmetsp:Transcript_116597/g.363093  ORF Transcript_116597/g.363093 Transcript_116597/m.363093 type:complete len:100 (-) Transcript_116597:184-483(-)